MNTVGILAIIFFPGVVGLILLANYADNPLSHMAGWLTVMPYATTTIWIALTLFSWQLDSPYFALDGIVFEALILIGIYWTYRNILIRNEVRFAFSLLFVLACLRSINSFFFGLSVASIYPIDLDGGGVPLPLWADVSIILGIAMPSLFAAVALIVTRSVTYNARIRHKRKNDESSQDENDLDSLDEIVEI